MLRVLIPLTLVALALVPDWASAFGRRRLLRCSPPVRYAVCPPPVVLPPCLPAFGFGPPVAVVPPVIYAAPQPVYAPPQPAVPTPIPTAPPPTAPAAPPRVEATPAPPSADPVRPADYPGRAAIPAPTSSSAAPPAPAAPPPAPPTTPTTGGRSDAESEFVPAVPKVNLAPQGLPGSPGIRPPAPLTAPGSPAKMPPIQVPVGPTSPNVPPTTAQKPSEPELTVNPAKLGLRPAPDGSVPPFAIPSVGSVSRYSPVSPRPAFDVYPVRGDSDPPPEGAKRPVGFFNLSGREIALTVEGQTVTLPANHQISASLGASFRWKTDAIGEQTSTLGAGDSGADVFIRR